MAVAPAYAYLSAYVVPLTILASYYHRHTLSTYLPVCVTFLLVPLIDWAVGVDGSNPSAEDICRYSGRRSYRYVLYAWPALQWSFLAWALYIARTDAALGARDLLGLCLSLGVLGGQGINVAHELFHKLSRVEQALGKALLVSVFYGHFYVEHTFGHHKHVATPRDPGTARLGESFYRFLPRAFFGSYASAWRIECERLRRQGRSALSPWHNQVLRFAALSSSLLAAARLALGRRAAVVFIVQCLVAIVLLEMVNYMEHYGLQRRRQQQQQTSGTAAQGEPADADAGECEYEPVRAAHSWNAPHRATNYILFKLQRHSDHHAHALRPYHVLATDSASPQMPAGYPSMVLLLLIPPLWRRVMDWRAKAVAADAPAPPAIRAYSS